VRKIFSAIWSYIKKTDKLLWLLTIIICAYSIIISRALDESFGLKSGLKMQYLSLAVGLFAALVASAADYNWIGRMWKIHAPLAYGLAIALIFFGHGREGTSRSEDPNWIAIAGVSIQPTEFLKVSFIVTFAYHLDKVGERINHPIYLLGVLLHAAGPILFIHYLNDDGTALIFAMIAAGMMFFAGLSWKYLVPAAAGVVAAIPLIWNYVMNYDQKARVLAIIQPNESDSMGISFQQNSALDMIGSGQLFGVGLYSEEHRWFSDLHSDFIFSFVGQALGFVGCLLLLFLIAAIAVKILANAGKSLNSLGSLICVGTFFMLVSHTVIHVGMNLKLLPVIGVPLPFFSMGGSFMMSVLLCVGISISVRGHSYKKDTLFG
jgi:rod shape determining protein RodA